MAFLNPKSDIFALADFVIILLAIALVFFVFSSSIFSI
jgi:hypothetical protein